MTTATYRIVNCDGRYANKETYTSKRDAYAAIEALKEIYQYNNGYWLETK